MIADDIKDRADQRPVPAARRALVMCISDPATDPRPRRMIKLLEANGFRIDVLSYRPSQDFATFEHLPLPSPSPRFAVRAARKLLYLGSCMAARSLGQPRIFEDWLARHYGWQDSAREIMGRSYAVIVVEDLSFLPMAMAVRGDAAVIFDAREYYPRQNEESALFRLIEGPVRTQLCRDYLHRCDQVITVSPGLATEFGREFGVSPEVVLSVPNHADVRPHPTDPTRIRMVHHGAANRNRRLEDMIDVVRRLDDRFELDVYLTGSSATIEDLKRHAAGCSRIRILPPVKYEAIIPTISTYDIGMFFNIPTTFNLRNALPNKLFEFIQARLMVAIGPSPDMKHFVDKYGCGVVAPEATVESMAKALQALTAEDIDNAKARSHEAAKELCFEHESKKLEHIIADVIDRRSSERLRVAASSSAIPVPPSPAVARNDVSHNPNMLMHRVLPVLLLQEGGLFKTQQFKKPVYVGDPINTVRIFNEKEVDEIVVLDIGASKERREPDYALIEEFAGECFMPLTYGGGVTTLAQAARLFSLGVEKICLQTAALRDMSLVTEIAGRFGSQAVAVSVDVKRSWTGGLQLYSAAEGVTVKESWLDFAQRAEAAGAGEIIVNAVNQDGTLAGPDLKLIQQAAEALSVPVVAVGGISSLQDIKAAVDAGASAVGAGAYFVFHGPHRAVLITYPRYAELEELFR